MLPTLVYRFRLNIILETKSIEAEQFQEMTRTTTVTFNTTFLNSYRIGQNAHHALTAFCKEIWFSLHSVKRIQAYVLGF